MKKFIIMLCAFLSFGSVCSNANEDTYVIDVSANSKSSIFETNGELSVNSDDNALVVSANDLFVQQDEVSEHSQIPVYKAENSIGENSVMLSQNGLNEAEIHTGVLSPYVNSSVFDTMLTGHIDRTSLTKNQRAKIKNANKIAASDWDLSLD